MVSTSCPITRAKSLLEIPAARTAPWLKMIPPASGSSSEPAKAFGVSWNITAPERKFPPLMRTV